MDYKDSQAYADAKSRKLWSVIIACLFVIAHIVIPAFISVAPFASIKAHLAWALVPVAFAIYLFILLRALRKDAWWCTQSNGGWIGMMVLGFASLVTVGWCIVC